ncbi:MAG: choice-of-anchor J domain-containing protein [Prolixibacteraceae bacterium]|jgi:hypothetical protein|nr:choice-of-anchor J domain-containing protein [Prolixibacteraceae bacterium]
MKKLLYIALGLVLLFSACDIVDPLKDDLDNLSNNIEQEFNYTLIDDDFASITSRALYLNPDDTVNADFLNSYKYFTPQVQPATYVPMLLDQLFPGLGSGSQAKISYSFIGEMPEDLSMYTNPLTFSFVSETYQMVSKDVQAAGYFSPLYNPEKYIPKILAEKLDTAVSADVYAIKYKYATVTPEIDSSSYAINPEWEGLFKEDLTEFTLINTKGDQTWEWAAAGDGSAAINGWDNGYFDNEDWMVSSTIDLSSVSNTYLQLTHGVEYYEEESLFILVSTNFDGDVEAATWTEIDFPNYEGSNKNTYIETDAIDLTNFDGEKITIAFKYISVGKKAPYWGIGNVRIGSYGYKTTGETPNTITDFYEYDGKDWTKLDNVYSLTKTDYKTLGLSSTSFTSSTRASNYLPLYAANKYAYAQEGDEVVFVYQHETETETITVADRLTKVEGTWESSYDYIQLVTEPYASTVDGWVFDPTVNFTMTKEDYSSIAYYVKGDPVLSKLDNNTFEDSEYYYGSSGFYQNFDVRNGKFYSIFATWEEAVTEAIGDVLLPIKYPEATTQYKGIDMYYVVHFLTYGAPSANYNMKFQCTKSAPDPEFTLVEGPIAE